MAECTRENNDLILVRDIRESVTYTYPDIRIDRDQNSWTASLRQDEGESRAGVTGWALKPDRAVWRLLEKSLGNTDEARAINAEVSAAIDELEQERRP